MTVHDLLSEDPIIANQRAALVAKRDRLLEIKRTLDEFPTVDADDILQDAGYSTPHAPAEPPAPMPPMPPLKGPTVPKHPGAFGSWASSILGVPSPESPEWAPISSPTGVKKAAKKGKERT